MLHRDDIDQSQFPSNLLYLANVIFDPDLVRLDNFAKWRLQARGTAGAAML